MTSDFIAFKNYISEHEEKENAEIVQMVESGNELLDKTKKFQKYLNWISLFLG